MNLSKLYGSRLLDNIKVPKIPSVILLDGNENLSAIKFQEGDLLDANSIKLFVKKISLPDNVVTFQDKASNEHPGIVQCGDNITISNGIIDIQSIPESFIIDLK